MKKLQIAIQYINGDRKTEMIKEAHAYINVVNLRTKYYSTIVRLKLSEIQRDYNDNKIASIEIGPFRFDSKINKYKITTDNKFMYICSKPRAGMIAGSGRELRNDEYQQIIKHIDVISDIRLLGREVY